MPVWLSQVPKGVIVFVVIAAGVGLIMYNEPPFTICDSQIKVFRQSQKGGLYAKKTKTGVRSASFNRWVESCKNSNNGGGCYDLFNSLKKIVRDLQDVPSECLAQTTSLEEIRSALLTGTELLVKIAWGEAPPTSAADKFNWLESGDVALFCQLRTMISAAYGPEFWEQLRARITSKLPGVEKVTAQNQWTLSLFSVRCEQYL